MFYQKEITLKPKPRGFHVITHEVEREVPQINKIQVGLLNLFIKHTSASLTINENVSPDVRSDMESHLNEIVPENAPGIPGWHPARHFP